jgi:NAD-reducing hydrogenase large subunit
MHHGQFLQSHALHFFHLSSPDLLFGFDADVSQHHVLAVAAHYPELATQGVLMRKFGQEIIRATAGRKIHGTGAIPGGINKNLSIEERDPLLQQMPQMLEWARSALDLARDYTRRNLEKLAPFGSFESNHLSIVREDGAYDIYNGGLRAREAQGELIFDHVDNQEYDQYIAEEVRSWSYMKFPFIRSLGPEKGWYRVGPLARVNNCDYFDTPEAEAARKEFKALTDDRPNNVTMAYHWARMIELLHSVEKIGELLHDSDLQGTDLQTRGARRNEAVGIIEAPRGTLFHHYVVDDNDLVVKANLIVSTTSNNEPMNRAVQRVAEDHLSGVPEISDGLLNHVEVAIRAYDPCLSCATHALGRMPLIVELVSAEGETVAQRVKG